MADPRTSFKILLHMRLYAFCECHAIYVKNVLYKNGQTCHHYMFLPIHESSYTLEISPNLHQGPLRRVLELTFLSLYPATKMRRQDPAQCCSRRDETSTLRLKIDIRSWLLCSTLNQVFPSMALQNAFGSFLYTMTARKTIFLGFPPLYPHWSIVSHMEIDRIWKDFLTIHILSLLQDTYNHVISYIYRTFVCFSMFFPKAPRPQRLFPRQATSACTAPAACARRRPPSWRTRAGRSVAAGDGSNRSWFQGSLRSCDRND